MLLVLVSFVIAVTQFHKGFEYAHRVSRIICSGYSSETHGPKNISPGQNMSRGQEVLRQTIRTTARRARADIVREWD